MPQDLRTQHASHRRAATRFRFSLLGAAALGALAVTGLAGGPATPLPAFAQTGQTAPAPQTAPSTVMPSFADVVDRVKPAVVSVRVKADEASTGGTTQLPPNFNLPDDHPLQEFFKRFQGPGQRGPQFGQPNPRRGSSQGSGFFISADGYLVTNNHVIEKSSDVEVVMDDGRNLKAKVVGTDPKTDLALLKVEDPTPFKYVEFATDTPRVGDWVLAVGNPFGLGGTVTAGIVSARGRDIGAGPYDDFIQIDAPVNRGNSGGPAFNQLGQVVGVNTAIYSPSGGNVGIAFAIPAETVQRVVAELRETGTIERGLIGVQIQPVTKDIATSLELERPQGAIVARVEENSPAAKAGVKTGDVVLSVDGKPVKDARELSRTIAFMRPGTTVALQVWRDGAKQDLSVTIGRQSSERTAAADAPSGTDMGKLGLSLAPASAAGADQKGVAVVAVESGSVADQKGFKTGDVIAEVGGRTVQTPADVRKALDDARKDGKKAVLFRVEASAGARFIAIEVPAA